MTANKDKKSLLKSIFKTKISTSNGPRILVEESVHRRKMKEKDEIIASLRNENENLRKELKELKKQLKKQQNWDLKSHNQTVKISKRKEAKSFVKKEVKQEPVEIEYFPS